MKKLFALSLLALVTMLSSTALAQKPVTVGGEPIRVKTTADGSVSLSLIPGDYVVESEKPLIVNGKSFEPDFGSYSDGRRANVFASRF